MCLKVVTVTVDLILGVTLPCHKAVVLLESSSVIAFWLYTKYISSLLLSPIHYQKQNQIKKRGA